MKIVVHGSQNIFNELRSANDKAEWVLVDDVKDFIHYKDAGAFFDLSENACTNDHPITAHPLFLNSVVHAVDPSKNAIRINGWAGFLKNQVWEIHGELKQKDKAVLDFLGKKPIQCADEPGFISARVIAMIINEAFFAEEQQVSTRSEMDIAMKLGTNYPYGPFEWAEIIGVKNIYTLLKKLAASDKIYEPALSLSKLVIN